MADERGRGFSTRAIHEAKAPPIDQETPSVPIYQTSTFRFADSDEYAETISFRKAGYTYTRGYGNPTLGAFEELMANLEGTESAFSFSSGMAAMHAVFTTLAATGDRIVSSNELYGGAYSLFTKVMPRYGVTVDLVDPHDLDAVAAAAPGRGVLLRRDDREPQRHRRGPRGAGRTVSRERCAGRRRQHVRVAVPGQPVALGVRVRACTRRRSSSGGTTT